MKTTITSLPSILIAALMLAYSCNNTASNPQSQPNFIEEPNSFHRDMPYKSGNTTDDFSDSVARVCYKEGTDLSPGKRWITIESANTMKDDNFKETKVFSIANAAKSPTTSLKFCYVLKDPTKVVTRIMKVSIKPGQEVEVKLRPADDIKGDEERVVGIHLMEVVFQDGEFETPSHYADRN